MNEKTILALGPAGSNGHEAALQAQKSIDADAIWTVRFCESNKQVLDTAIEYGMYAVVPVENSVGGPVKTIADGLFRTCGRDSKARVIGKIDLNVTHCLLSHPSHALGYPSQIVSHPQALSQCSNFLVSRGWMEIVSSTESTSAAARLVGSQSKSCALYCIASEFAAHMYGLYIHQRAIQNEEYNITQFAILGPTNEPALMKKSLGGVTVAIVGADGGYGKWLTAFFELNGCKVKGIDARSPLPEALSIVSESEVVIFSVPTIEASSIIREYVAVSQLKQLWLDVTSLKVETMKAMQESSAEVVGMHPLCAPPKTLSLRGQALAVCIGRLSVWGPWFASLLSLMEADIDVVDSEVHDRLVAERQGLPHALMFIEAAVMRELRVDVKESLRVASPFYRLLLDATCRMHHQNPKVYAGIQIGNPHMLGILNLLKDKLEQLINIVQRGDQDGFVALFNEHRKHIGSETLARGNDSFEFMVSLLVDLEAKNALVIQSELDKKGLLEHLTGIIAANGVNMTSMHTRPTREGGHRFIVGLDMPTSSDEVHRVVKQVNSSGLAKVILS